MKMTKTLLIFLHGSGGTGPELRTFLDTIPLEQFGMKTFYNVTKEKSIEYVCPTAVKRPYTPAMGESMNVWFDRGADFVRNGLNDKEDLPGANGSVNQVRRI
jgi:Phospholipase/Carboxylesterase